MSSCKPRKNKGTPPKTQIRDALVELDAENLRKVATLARRLLQRQQRKQTYGESNVTKLARESGMSYFRLRKRILSGYSREQALTLPRFARRNSAKYRHLVPLSIESVLRSWGCPHEQ